MMGVRCFSFVCQLMFRFCTQLEVSLSPSKGNPYANYTTVIFQEIPAPRLDEVNGLYTMYLRVYPKLSRGAK